MMKLFHFDFDCAEIPFLCTEKDNLTNGRNIL